MKFLLFICYTLIVTVSVTKQQECSPEGSIRIFELGNATCAVFGIVQICGDCVDQPCRWLPICSDGWTSDTARYTCDNTAPAYENGTAIEMYFRFPPLPSLNISACASVYPNCSDAPIQTCRNYAGVICTEKCETPTVVTTTQYPTTSQPTPTPICNGILDPCTVGIVILGLLAALLLILLIASVVGCLCTCVGCLCASCVATQRSKSTQHDAVHLSKM